MKQTTEIGVDSNFIQFFSGESASMNMNNGGLLPAKYYFFMKTASIARRCLLAFMLMPATKLYPSLLTNTLVSP